MSAGYRVVLHAYCGMTCPHGDPGMDRDEARQEVARLIRRRRRQGFPVVTLSRGSTWEVQEPEDAMMVPDESGTLRLIVPDDEEDDAP